MHVFIFLLGLGIGSFIGALTYRWPHEISINNGRSVCPKCKRQIKWYDNIPLLSYLALGGKCRNCDKKISARYFAIELSTGIIFLLTTALYSRILVNLNWLADLPFATGLAILLVIISISWAIFIIDLEHQYIPDSLSFILFGLVISVFLITHNSQIWIHLLSGLCSALFLLLINLLTLGKGMGLGDVKLALWAGMIFGFPLSVVWMFLSFIIGSIVGVVLLASKATKLKQKIAFGPFLVTSLFITAVCGFRILGNVWVY